jgi:hypothetical protein
MDKFGSVIDRTCMKLGNNFLNSLRVENQHVIVVDGATVSQKDGVEGSGDSLKDGAEAFVLFLRGNQLVLLSSVLTLIDLEADVTLENAEIFRSVLSGEDGSAGGGWRCC